ncbi:hypothetical protein [Xanthocytophaga flava]|uniref:hypothetical protein n=1 Tax=Xanthocytophaga flava TaxID=3048013 RepID=UPI0028D439E8|nr:hypothetical protein [Xanthocytophaga flavus]MDJ1467398.1 hypothetical protein [Xanthocytophaga flavus]
MLQKILLYFLVLFTCTFGVFESIQAQSSVQGAQTKEPDKSPSDKHSPTRLLEIGIGPTAYKGDLASSYRKWASAFYIGVKFNRKHRVNGHLNLAIGSITGQNPSYVFTGESETTPTPNLYFKTTFFSLNYDLQINLIKTPRWIVYVSQGIGFMRYNPKDEYGNNFQDQLNTRAANETYGSISAILPTQAGVIYLLPNGYGAGIQGGWLNTQTDYLDNISQWGNRSKKDNALWLKFQFIVPLTF